MTRILLIRHGIAAPADPQVVTRLGEQGADDSRPLTPRGRRRLRPVARGLERLGVEFDVLFQSPRLRAVETADELAKVLGCPTAVCAVLAEPPGPALLARFERDLIGVVGHMPYLADLVATLCGSPDAARFPWKRGGVVWLEGEPIPGGMQMRMLLPPRVFRLLD